MANIEKQRENLSLASVRVSFAYRGGHDRVQLLLLLLNLTHSPSIHITSIAENKFLPSAAAATVSLSVVLVDLLSICSLVYSSVYPSRLSSVTAFTASAKT